MVGTIHNTVDIRATASQFADHPPVQGVDFVLAVVASRHARLVGRDKCEEARVVDVFHRGLRAFDPTDLIGPIGITDVFVQYAIAIEDHRAATK